VIFVKKTFFWITGPGEPESGLKNRLFIPILIASSLLYSKKAVGFTREAR
jgi:hypothetical protein